MLLDQSLYPAPVLLPTLPAQLREILRHRNLAPREGACLYSKGKEEEEAQLAVWSQKADLAVIHRKQGLEWS